MSEVAHNGRLDKVESEVATIRTDMAEIRSDVRGLGSILQRIETGVAEAQQRFDNREQASRLNPIAMGSVLLTIISILVGGSWLISGELARHDERSMYQQRILDRMELRQWDVSGRVQVRPGGRDVTAPPN